MTRDVDKLPEGQSVDDWVEKGLARVATTKITRKIAAG